jgi:hypothetical protein
METSALLGIGLWGYAEADPTVVAILVAIVVALAIVYVVLRLSGGSGPRANKRKDAGKRG